MESFLILVHDVLTGNVVRQIVVSAEDGLLALKAVAHLIGPGEHGTVVPTGSQPDLSEPEPVSEPAPEAVSVELPTIETGAQTVPEPVQLAEPDPSELIIDELNSLPPDIYAAVVARLTNPEV